jgi:hypothetical protein
MTLTISPIVIWFILGFILGIILKKYGVKILWNIWKLLFTLYAALYYRPKVRRYKKLLIKRGWKPCSEYRYYTEWEHPQKGKKYFYTACCEEAGKKVRI